MLGATWRYWGLVLERENQNAIDPEQLVKVVLLCDREGPRSQERENQEAAWVNVETEWAKMDLQIKILRVEEQIIHTHQHEHGQQKLSVRQLPAPWDQCWRVWAQALIYNIFCLNSKESNHLSFSLRIEDSNFLIFSFTLSNEEFVEFFLSCYLITRKLYWTSSSFILFLLRLYREVKGPCL